MSKALDDISAERARQLAEEGWSPIHDDAHRYGEMAGAAACYVLNSVRIRNDRLAERTREFVKDLWPWAQHWWKPKDRRRDLVRAGALIVAEIERLDRAGTSLPDHSASRENS